MLDLLTVYLVNMQIKGDSHLGYFKQRHLGDTMPNHGKKDKFKYHTVPVESSLA